MVDAVVTDGGEGSADAGSSVDLGNMDHCPDGTSGEDCVPCPDGRWDHDGEAHTACIPWSECGPGATDEGGESATNDRRCVPHYDRCFDAAGRRCYDFLRSPYGVVDDRFGLSVAVSGDTLVVGAPGESSSATGVNDFANIADNTVTRSGAVFVYERGEAGWTLHSFLKAAHPGAGDAFGWTVALDGDVLVIGAPTEGGGTEGVNGDELDNTGPSSGAAYVFERDAAGRWRQTAYLKASRNERGAHFGKAVSVENRTIVVGAPREKSMAAGVYAPDALPNAERRVAVGAAHIFARSADGGWSQRFYVKPNNPRGAASFGGAVQLRGDLLVVGSKSESDSSRGIDRPNHDRGRVQSGAVHVFARRAGIWTQIAYLKSSNSDGSFYPGLVTVGGDEFGGAVAVSGTTLAIGAVGEGSAASGIDGDKSDESSRYSGAVYLFDATGGRLEETLYIKSPRNLRGNVFGSSLALDGDTLVVGEPSEQGANAGIDPEYERAPGTKMGAVHVYRRVDGRWRYDSYLKSSFPDISSQFGTALALDGETLVIGVPYDDVTEPTNSGAVYVRDLR